MKTPKENMEKMPFKIGGGGAGEIKEEKKIAKAGSKDTTKISNPGNRKSAPGNDAKPLASGVKDKGMMNDKPKVSPTKPGGERLERWMDKRNEQCAKKK